MLSEADHARVTAAIEAAEARTSGEIYCVVARTPHRYPQVVLAVAAATAFIVPLAAVLAGFDPAAWLPGAEWRSGHEAGDWRRAVEAYAALQLLLFLGLAALLWFTPLGGWLTPDFVRRERVHEEAMKQFLAKGIHVTEGRTGVLIYVSEPDRIAEVVADRAIYARVPAGHWAGTVAALIDGIRKGRTADGFVGAIGHAADVLAEHFPPGSENPNELPDRLVEV